MSELYYFNISFYLIILEDIVSCLMFKEKVSDNPLKNVGGVGILVIDTSLKWRFEIWPFLWAFVAKVVNLSPIDF